MPEGRLASWRWMLRRSDASGGVLSWDAHVDVWCVGFRLEAKREPLNEGENR